MKKITKLCQVVCIGTLTVACGDSLDPRDNAAEIEIVSGDHQSARAGSELASELVVQVRDGEGNPLASVVVAWVANEEGSSANPTTSITDNQGEARTRWTLGPAAGHHTLQAVVSGVGVASFSATAMNEATP